MASSTDFLFLVLCAQVLISFPTAANTEKALELSVLTVTKYQVKSFFVAQQTTTTTRWDADCRHVNKLKAICQRNGNKIA